MIHKYLIIKPSSLGDIIHGLQVIESLKSEMDNKIHVTWVVRDIFAPFVSSCKTVDEVLIFERNGGLKSFINLMKRIRSSHYECVVDLQGLLRSGILSFAARAPRKITRSDTREGAGLFVHEKMAYPRSGKVHAVDILLQLKPLFGKKAELSSFLEFDSNPVELPTIQESTKIVTLFPESRRAEKVWPYFKELAESLLAENYTVVWSGSDKTSWSKNYPKNFINLSGSLELDQIPSLLERSDLVISNDSGPMHLAASMGKRVLALFGPTDPAMYGPYPLDNKMHNVLRSSTGQMKDLSLESVLSTVDAIFE